MNFVHRNSSFSNKRPHSSCEAEIRSTNIHTKNVLIRDNYKQKLLQQRQNELFIQRKYKQDLEKRSAKRFLNSPFAVNILADTEIQEHERYLISKTKKAKSLSKPFKKPKEGIKFISRLRKEIRKIDEEEKQIHSQILAQKSEEKLKKAKKARKLYHNSFVYNNSTYQKPFWQNQNFAKIEVFSDFDEKD